MVRRVSTEKYVVAAIITGGIFLLGFLLGFIVEEKRVEYLQEESRIQALDFNSLQVQYAYLDQFGTEENCEAVQRTFEQNVQELEDVRIRLVDFDRDATLEKRDFELLKREYSLAQLRYWLFAKRTKEICDSELVTILYFFSDEKGCKKCDEQGFILTYLKKLFGDKLLIFSFDERNENEPMIKILKNTYLMKEYPTIIVENKKFSGFSTKDELLGEVCRYYSNETEACSP